jgi:hypothetical protein
MAEPWFDANSWAWLPGTLLGVFGGLWGSLTGIFAPRGKGRSLILGLGWSLFGVSVVLFVAGLTALAFGQPYGVWYGLGQTGMLGTLILAVLLPVAMKRYREAEERRMRDGQLN